MTITLTAPVGYADAVLPVSSDLPSPFRTPCVVQIGTEQALVLSSGTTWLVERGYNGTGASAHDAGTTVTPISLGSGGGGFDYVQVSDPGAVGAGKTWLQLPPTISGTVVPAASLQLWRRNETDDGWTPIGAGDRFTTPVVEGHTYFWDAEGNPVSDIYRGADGEIDIYSLGGYGSTLSITAHDGMTLGGPSISLDGLIVTGNNWLPLVRIIHSDPTAGGGGFQTPLVFDDTAVTGGLYAWNEAGYLKVGGPLP